MKRKIIVINDFPLYPPRFGGQFRIYYIYKNLSKWFDITYICFGNGEKLVEKELCQDFKEIQIPKSRMHRIMNIFLGRLFGKAVDDIVAMFFCKFNRKMNHIIKNNIRNDEIIVASHPYMYPAIKKHAKNRFLIYEAHNVEYILKRTILGKGIFKKILYNHVKKIEGDVIRKSDLIFTTSALDLYKMQEIYNSDDVNMYISSNGVDVSAYNILFKKNVRFKKNVINYPIAIFMASGHPPNVDAAKKIINEIAPKMRGIYFLICGSVCWSLKNDEIGKNVGLTFEVSDEEKLELYRISDVALNPMLSGSGTNLKMLDYMAAGLPVITTPTGARGLEVENNNCAIICEIQEFPEKIREVLDNKELYEKISHNGRTLVEEKYDWEKIAEDMAKILGKMGSHI